jgi:hypothetical protein
MKPKYVVVRSDGPGGWCECGYLTREETFSYSFEQARVFGCRSRATLTAIRHGGVGRTRNGAWVTVQEIERHD